MTLTFDLLTLNFIGHIPVLDSWGDCMWSFMRIGVKGKQLCAWNNFTLPRNPCIATLTFDLLTPKSIGSILDSWGDCMWSFIKIGVKGSSYAPESFFSNPCIVTLTFDLLTPKPIGSILESWGDCMWSFMKIGVKGKQLCARNHFQ